MSQVELTPVHIAKKKKVGHIDGQPVFHVATTGGFHMILAARKGKFETLGTGPHPAVAKHLAMKLEPKVVFTDLNKGDYADPRDFESILPEYRSYTDRMRRLQGV